MLGRSDTTCSVWGARFGHLDRPPDQCLLPASLLVVSDRIHPWLMHCSYHISVRRMASLRSTVSRKPSSVLSLVGGRDIPGRRGCAGLGGCAILTGRGGLTLSRTACTTSAMVDAGLGPGFVGLGVGPTKKNRPEPDGEVSRVERVHARGQRSEVG